MISHKPLEHFLRLPPPPGWNSHGPPNRKYVPVEQVRAAMDAGYRALEIVQVLRVSMTVLRERLYPDRPRKTRMGGLPPRTSTAIAPFHVGACAMPGCGATVVRRAREAAEQPAPTCSACAAARMTDHAALRRSLHRVMTNS